MFTIIQQGGFIMWIIFSLSVLSLAVIIERLIFFASSKCNISRLIEKFGK